jgi:hypothetical protein
VLAILVSADHDPALLVQADNVLAYLVKPIGSRRSPSSCNDSTSCRP